MTPIHSELKRLEREQARGTRSPVMGEDTVQAVSTCGMTVNTVGRRATQRHGRAFRGRVAPMHYCIGAPSDPYVPLVAAYGSSKPRRACQA